MNTLIFLLLLLLLVVTPGPEGSPSSAQTEECLAGNNILGLKKVANITTVTSTKPEQFMNTTLYVNPNHGSIDVRLVVRESHGRSNHGGRGEVHATQFSLDKDCFPSGYKRWEMVWVKARLMSKKENNGLEYYEELKLQVRTSICIKPCIKTGIFTSDIKSLQVQMRGNLCWRSNCTPTLCGDVPKWKEDQYKSNFPQCVNESQWTPKPSPTVEPTQPNTSPSPSLGSTTQPNTSSSLSPENVAAVVAGIVLLLLFLLLVVMVIGRRRGQAANQDVVMRPQNTQSPHEHTTVNSLYETVDRQEYVNNLYETVDRPGSVNNLNETVDRQEAVNNFYETVDRQEPVNDLYETVDRPGSVNSLYETFENFRPNQHSSA